MFVSKRGTQRKRLTEAFGRQTNTTKIETANDLQERFGGKST